MTSRRQGSRRRIYVPVLHGIGTNDHAKFVERSVVRIAAHLDGSAQWHASECRDSDDGFSPGHRHYVHSSHAEAVIDPISWFDLIKTPRRRDAARWLARTLFVLCCVHLLVNGYAVLNIFSGLPSLGESISHPLRTLRSLIDGIWRVLRAMIWILVLGLGSIAVVLPAVALIFVCPPALRFTSDALGWSTDESSRETVLKRVSAQVSRPRADHVLLIGHSQGGAIAAEAARRGSTRNTTLVTLGSGFAILAAIRIGGSVSARAVVGIVVAIVSYAVIAAFALVQFASEAVRLVALLLLEAAHWGIAMWSVAIAPEVSLSHSAESMKLSMSATARVLAFTPDTGFLLITPLIAIPIVWVYARAIKPAAERVVAECRLDVPGVDLCATFDPVSFPLAAFGDASRIRRITQSASMTDHLRYFSNRHEVLGEIEMQLTQAALSGTRRTSATHHSSDAALLSAEATHSARTARVARISSTFAVALVASVAWPSAPLVAALCALVAYVCGTLVKTWSWSCRQNHSAKHSMRRCLQRPGHPMVYGAVAVISAMTMAGALTVPVSSVGILLAGAAYVSCIVAACCALGRAVWSAGLLSASLVLTAAAWGSQLTGYGAVMCALCALLAVASAVRQIQRHRAARRAIL